MKRRGYNGAKAVILAHFAKFGRWQDAKELTRVVRWRSERTMPGYLCKLWRWGLLFRRTVPRVEYRLTERGRERLAWLRSRQANGKCRVH